MKFFYRGDIVNKRIHDEKNIIGVTRPWRPWRISNVALEFGDCRPVLRTLTNKTIFAVRSNKNGTPTRNITIINKYIRFVFAVNTEYCLLIVKFVVEDCS
jgi:hypothetical protein